MVSVCYYSSKRWNFSAKLVKSNWKSSSPVRGRLSGAKIKPIFYLRFITDFLNQRSASRDLPWTSFSRLDEIKREFSLVWFLFQWQDFDSGGSQNRSRRSYPRRPALSLFWRSCFGLYYQLPMEQFYILRDPPRSESEFQFYWLLFSRVFPLEEFWSSFFC